MNNTKNISLFKIKKILQKKGYVISKRHRFIPESFVSLYYTSLISIFLIGFFYLTPLIFKVFKTTFTKNEIVLNNSNINFNKVLEGKEIELENKNESEEVNYKDLFFDVLDIEINAQDTVRLSASTLEQLFEDENYNLKDIRKNKLVKPINIDLLPNEIKSIESSRKRKELFIQIVLPLILDENKKIKLERKTLFSILNKNSNSEAERNWLKSKFKQYGVVNRDLTTLKIRMDEIPVSLAIAQAAKETGWGTSRFAQEGNALFGQWTWSGEGLKPKDADKSQGHKVMKFNVLQASVRAYQRNLNTHSSYKNLRKVRAQLRDAGKPIDSLILVKYLNEYAETGEKYVEVLTKIIKQNNLKDFDDAKLLPSSIELESLI